MTTDHYDTLGVPRDADGKTIKRAYRKKSMKAHPDRGGSEERMANLNQAYQCLADPVRRETYDRFGQDVHGFVLDQRVKGLICKTFAKVVEECENGMLDTTKQRLRSHMDRIQAVIAQATVSRDKLQRKRSKVKSKDGEQNLFHLVVDDKIKHLSVALQQMELDFKITKSALDVLNQYESDDDFVSQQSTTIAFRTL